MLMMRSWWSIKLHPPLLFIMARPKTKWERRDKKRHKKKHGMRIVGRSILLLDEIIKKRAKKKKEKDA